jgi:hypothetical protein
VGREVTADRAIFADAALKAYANANALRDSGKAAASLGNYGHGAALNILSLEELGKAIAFRLCYEGWGHVEGSGKQAEVVLTLPFVGTKRYRLYWHEPKRDLVYGLVMWFLAPSIAMLLSVAVTTPSGQLAVAKLAVDSEPEESPKDSSRFDLEDPDTFRERGFYVELEDGQLKIPQEFPRDAYETSERAVSSFLLAYKEALERGITAQFIEMARSAADRVVELGREWNQEGGHRKAS